jgi:hypothetical protein
MRKPETNQSASKKKCPKHGVSYALRQNAKTGELAIACPLCDVEAHGGSDRDVAAVANLITKAQWK